MSMENLTYQLTLSNRPLPNKQPSFAGPLAGLLSADLGQVITPTELAKLGERIVTVERLLAQQWYHIDGLPTRWASQALENGPAANQLPDLEALIERYYARHMWDAEGTPTAARLAELSIPDPASRPWAK